MAAAVLSQMAKDGRPLFRVPRLFVYHLTTGKPPTESCSGFVLSHEKSFLTEAELSQLGGKRGRTPTKIVTKDIRSGLVQEYPIKNLERSADSLLKDTPSDYLQADGVVIVPDEKAGLEVGDLVWVSSKNGIPQSVRKVKVVNLSKPRMTANGRNTRRVGRRRSPNLAYNETSIGNILWRPAKQARITMPDGSGPSWWTLTPSGHQGVWRLGKDYRYTTTILQSVEDPTSVWVKALSPERIECCYHDVDDNTRNKRALELVEKLTDELLQKRVSTPTPPFGGNSPIMEVTSAVAGGIEPEVKAEDDPASPTWTLEPPVPEAWFPSPKMESASPIDTASTYPPLASTMTPDAWVPSPKMEHAPAVDLAVYYPPPTSVAPVIDHAFSPVYSNGPQDLWLDVTSNALYQPMLDCSPVEGLPPVDGLPYVGLETAPCYYGPAVSGSWAYQPHPFFLDDSSYCFQYDTAILASPTLASPTTTPPSSPPALTRPASGTTTRRTKNHKSNSGVPKTTARKSKRATMAVPIVHYSFGR